MKLAPTIYIRWLFFSNAVETLGSLQQIINFRASKINHRLVTSIEIVVHLPHEELKETAVDSINNVINKKFSGFSSRNFASE